MGRPSLNLVSTPNSSSRFAQAKITGSTSPTLTACAAKDKYFSLDRDVPEA